MSASGLNASAPVVQTLPGAAQVLANAGQENFPVALWFLPTRIRRRLMAVYGFARLVDDVGDEGSGTMGLPPALLPHGRPADILAEAGLDGAGLATAVLRALPLCPASIGVAPPD